MRVFRIPLARIVAVGCSLRLDGFRSTSCPDIGPGSCCAIEHQLGRTGIGRPGGVSAHGTPVGRLTRVVFVSLGERLAGRCPSFGTPFRLVDWPVHSVALFDHLGELISFGIIQIHGGYGCGL